MYTYISSGLRLTCVQLVVDSMHERKIQMAKRSVGFIGLPGGFGSFEEVISRALIPIIHAYSALSGHGSRDLDPAGYSR